MNRVLLLAFVAVLFGCPKNPPANAPDGHTPAQPPAESRTGAESAPDAQPAAPSGATDAPAEVGEADIAEEAPTNGAPATGGRLAKPGWCDKDDDCSAGSVCEKCGPEGQCVPGCHNTLQCAKGEYCNQVQCIRCPCPGICELKTP